MLPRAGLKRVKVYNEGLLVFLYDKAHIPRIRKEAPDLGGGFRPRNRKLNKQLQPLAADGTLVTYELVQDDSLDIAVGVGRPLTAGERKGVAWRPPQTALLHLPSGQLFIDSYNSLRAGDEKPDERGGTVKVPPGYYVVTLHRVDGKQMPEGYEGPSEVITLTPTRKKRLKEAPPYLPAVDDDGLGRAKPGRVTVDGWEGKVIDVGHDADEGAFVWLNLDHEHAEELGLEWPRQLVLEAGGASYSTVFHGNDYSRGEQRRKLDAATLKTLADTAPFSAYIDMRLLQGPGNVAGVEHWLRVSALEAGKHQDSGLFRLKVGTPVRARVGPPILQAPAPPPCRFETGALHGVVLVREARYLAFNATASDVHELKASRDQWLELELEDGTYPVLDRAGASIFLQLTVQESKTLRKQKPLAYRYTRPLLVSQKHYLTMAPFCEMLPEKEETVPKVAVGSPFVLRPRATPLVTVSSEDKYVKEPAARSGGRPTRRGKRA